MVLLIQSSALPPGTTRNWIAPAISTPYRGETLTVRNPHLGLKATYHLTTVQSRRVVASFSAPGKRPYLLEVDRSTSGAWTLASLQGLRHSAG